ncbi:MAG: Rpn family recombination-promoting nuclease/putative transposase, partial [bacterium]|nr:Rpn family recombination-promoting nuclease/putative transposase [bacterium]
SKDILISFLNAIIDFEKGETIVDLTIVDPYQIPLIKGMKDTYVDVKARLSNNKNVIIEMQVLNVEGLEKRILYNAAKSYSTQLPKGEDFTTLKPIIALTITDFIMFKDVDKIITYFNLIEKKALIRYKDEIELIFIELPKFDKNEEELDSITDKWIYFIKNAGRLEYTPKTLEKELEIKKAFEIANTANLSKKELEAQYKRHDFIRLQKGWMAFALKQGIEQGTKKGKIEGKIEGKKEKATEIAKTLLSFGDDIERVSTATGLTVKEIKKLVESEK